MVPAEGKWTATIRPEPPLISPRFEAAGDTPREAAERAYAKYRELLSTEKTSRREDVSEEEGSKEPDA
jgi:hypothetical protein